MRGAWTVQARVIGAGLAGSEAAWQLARRGIKVELLEQKPVCFSPAHKSEGFAELVCSNSLRAAGLENAVGLLKHEMRALSSLIMECADENSVPAGGALAVDRRGFEKSVTERIKAEPNITVITERVSHIDADIPTVIATGPLTDDELFSDIQKKVGRESLHFFDAAAPIVEFESINMDKAYLASRYGRGTPDYINCPMTREEYDAFYDALITAQCAELHDFEKGRVFEGCMPVEVMAARGRETLLFGPLKPVGLTDPHTGKLPHAVVQLRRDNADGTMYNMVGFQTHLKFPEQKRVFSMIPGLENAAFSRYGVMHRNTFIDSPRILDKFYRMKHDKNIWFAGQITGVEGYVESASSGLLCGLNLARVLSGKDPVDFTRDTAIGALSNYISDETVESFQPMNVNFGIMSPLGFKVKPKREKNLKISERALLKIEELKKSFNI
ncbi:MAG: methylenetetrahydrofolate--tRNA-(uracil(54)-C(5))-methyltransferase (FADH(2)-oxidizing) TrmFO [Clostridia bacterium]|nr:methylenetetrahydrofolate--tRNA-(uracil(54)-C(5))-methyltransferase (FADH(2)-oxidizing) TrmFO [Clostridia bacterium]